MGLYDDVQPWVKRVMHKALLEDKITACGSPKTESILGEVEKYMRGDVEEAAHAFGEVWRAAKDPSTKTKLKEVEKTIADQSATLYKKLVRKGRPPSDATISAAATKYADRFTGQTSVLGTFDVWFRERSEKKFGASMEIATNSAIEYAGTVVSSEGKDVGV